MTSKKILFLCSGNSSRSILGEYLLRWIGRGRFETFSAGPNPVGLIDPLTLRVLQQNYNIDASAGRSKSWDEFKEQKFDLVITVCDRARETCPAWPGAPLLAHWGSPDPAEVGGTDRQKFWAFIQVASQIARRSELLCALPEAKLFDRTSVRAIGQQAELETVVPAAG
jgi:arsenate reductase